jgi:hypothetical protein
MVAKLDLDRVLESGADLRSILVLSEGRLADQDWPEAPWTVKHLGEDRKQDRDGAGGGGGRRRSPNRRRRPPRRTLADRARKGLQGRRAPRDKEGSS